MPGYRTGGTESESGDHYLDRGELTPVTERLVHPDQAGISDMESHGVTWSHMESHGDDTRDGETSPP